ncbi:MAG: RsmD family RNA methyltransferase [Bifidobacteriaceae bacterium]|jgi:16S rRNA (guanine966-N2)-methyltransferase|nr:RsmD family RNA methyltransferase [Bifidobacteriaceae bacterium]
MSLVPNVRIIQGQYKGLRLDRPTHKFRPTMSRIREAFINVMLNNFGDMVIGSRVLDLFAGSGSYGFELLSAGSGPVLFVDQARSSVLAIKQTLKNLNCRGDQVFLEGSTAIQANLRTWRPKQTYDIITLDPPYGYEVSESCKLINRLSKHVSKKAMLVFESASRSERVSLEDWDSIKTVQIGDTRLEFYISQLA